MNEKSINRTSLSKLQNIIVDFMSLIYCSVEHDNIIKSVYHYINETGVVQFGVNKDEIVFSIAQLYKKKIIVREYYFTKYRIKKNIADPILRELLISGKFEKIARHILSNKSIFYDVGYYRRENGDTYSIKSYEESLAVMRLAVFLKDDKLFI